MKKRWLVLIIILAMAFSSVVLAEEMNYFCKTGDTPTTTYPMKISITEDGEDWCAICRKADGFQEVGEILIKKGDPLPLSSEIIVATIPMSEFYLMVLNTAIKTEVIRTDDSLQVEISYSCCEGVVSWQVQLYTVLPEGTFVTGKKYQICFQYKQTGIPVGGVTLEGQKHTTPYDPLGLWEYLLLSNDGTVHSYSSVPFTVNNCLGQQRIDFALAGKPGPVSGYFTLIGDVIIKEILTP